MIKRKLTSRPSQRRTIIEFMAMCLLITVVFSGCVNPGQESTPREIPVFFMGMIHGFIAIIDWVFAALMYLGNYNIPVSIYDCNLQCLRYDTGFVLGFLIFLGVFS